MSDVIEIKGRYYILASSSVADAATRVLKHADTFAIFDRHGDIRPLGFENQGLFHEGTRFISRLKLELNGGSPLLLSSNVREDNDFLVADLTNPDLVLECGRVVPRGSIHLVRTLFLWDGSYYERVHITNYSLHPLKLPLSLSYQADFADLFEIRGITRQRRGQWLSPEIYKNQVRLKYEGLDAVVRESRIHFAQGAIETTPDRAVFDLELGGQSQTMFEYQIDCQLGDRVPPESSYDSAMCRVQGRFEAQRSEFTSLHTSNEQFNDWIDQSRADLHMLLTETACGVYPHAGIPWFSCPFGRDGIITALETLWIHPDIARGVLCYLARTQATESNAGQDAEPGKILHEERKGEMAALGEVPFARYYGAIDTTPLFVLLAGRFYDRTADREMIEELWPHLERALSWIDGHGDQDGDGFVEYHRRATGGLANQGWKDSEDSIFHADGRLASPPIALCEVQGYVYEARLQGARLASVLGRHSSTQALLQSARELKRKFRERFWCDDLGTYALALDGEKHPCKVHSSNAGQCLFTGIVGKEHASRMNDQLMRPEFFSGWGIRTMPTTAALYNPMSYHNGSIWPHDNALIAHGFAAYGFRRSAERVLTALFDASRCMDLCRLPELYCGFPRRSGEGPTLYPVACNPQAWASGAVYLLVQSCLGMQIHADQQRVHFKNPLLPEALQHAQIRNLRVGRGAVDISLERHGQDVAINVRRRVGKVQVVVTH